MRLGFILFAGFAWVLWKARNKMAIEKVFPKHPVDTFYIGLSFIQKWGQLLKPNDQEKLAKGVELLKTWLNNYLPIQEPSLDIVEL